MKFITEKMRGLTTVLAVLALPLAATAQSVTDVEGDGPAFLQVIHNAADPGAAEVDIYLNGTLLLDDFAFREATGFTELESGVEYTIGVAPGNSTGAGDIIADFQVTLSANTSYIAVANGVLSPDDFSANPDELSIAFNLEINCRC